MSITHHPNNGAWLLPVVEAQYPMSAREWPGKDMEIYAHVTHINLAAYEPASASTVPWRFIVKNGQLDALLSFLRRRHVPAEVVGVTRSWPEPEPPQWPTAEAASMDMLRRYPGGLEGSWTPSEAADYWTLCWQNQPDPYNRTQTKKHVYAWGHVQRFTSLAEPMRSRGKAFYVEVLNIIRLREGSWPVTEALEPAYELRPVCAPASQN